MTKLKTKKIIKKPAVKSKARKDKKRSKSKSKPAIKKLKKQKSIIKKKPVKKPFLIKRICASPIFSAILIGIILATGIFYFKNALQDSYDQELQRRLANLDNYQAQFQRQYQKQGQDKTRVLNAFNLILALQDYSLEQGDYPVSLSSLEEKGYLNINLSFKEIDRIYYYKRFSSIKYVLCSSLSTGVWGTDIKECPSREALIRKEKYMNNGIIQNPEEIARKAREEAKEQQAPEIVQDDQFLVSVIDGLRVRIAADLSADVIAKIDTGTEYLILEQGKDWIKIQLNQGSGWVWKEYIEIEE